MCILLDEYMLLFGSHTNDVFDASSSETTQPDTSEQSDVDPCAPHGYLHDDHCDCNAGYIPQGLSCVALSELLTSQEKIAETPIQKKVISAPTQTNTADPCAPHGWQHGDHCDCRRGYVGQGLSCVSLASLLQQTETQQGATPETLNMPTMTSLSKVEDDTDGCGAGGYLHNDHCDCDTGFLPIDLMCVPIESLLSSYTSHTGEQFTEASLVFEQYVATYTEDIDAVILNWRAPEGPYDGFLIQGVMENVTVHAEVMPKYRHSYRYQPQESGLHTISILPYVLLEDGTPLLYETDASTLAFVQAEAPDILEPEILHASTQKGTFAKIAEIIRNLFN